MWQGLSSDRAHCRSRLTRLPSFRQKRDDKTAPEGVIRERAGQTLSPRKTQRGRIFFTTLLSERELARKVVVGHDGAHGEIQNQLATEASLTPTVSDIEPLAGAPHPYLRASHERWAQGEFELVFDVLRIRSIVLTLTPRRAAISPVDTSTQMTSKTCNREPGDDSGPDQGWLPSASALYISFTSIVRLTCRSPAKNYLRNCSRGSVICALMP